MRTSLKRFPLLLLGLAIPLASVACGDNGTGPLDPTELEFAASLGVNLDEMTKTASGLYYQDLVVGDGAEVSAGQTVTVHYTGWLHDGTQFDSSLPGDPVTFSLAGNLIQGWKEGVPGMKVGGKRKLVIPPSLAYGKKSVGSIPRNATLVFDIELIGIGGG